MVYLSINTNLNRLYNKSRPPKVSDKLNGHTINDLYLGSDLDLGAFLISNDSFHVIKMCNAFFNKVFDRTNPDGTKTKYTPSARSKYDRARLLTFVMSHFDDIY